MARSRKHFCSGNPTIRSGCTVKLYITVNNVTVVLHNNVLWRNCRPHNNKTYLGIQVQCAIFVSDFNQFLSFSTISNFPPVTAALMQADRQAVGQTKLTGA